MEDPGEVVDAPPGLLATRAQLELQFPLMDLDVAQRLLDLYGTEDNAIRAIETMMELGMATTLLLGRRQDARPIRMLVRQVPIPVDLASRDAAGNLILGDYVTYQVCQIVYAVIAANVTYQPRTRVNWNTVAEQLANHSIFATGNDVLNFHTRMMRRRANRPEPIIIVGDVNGSKEAKARTYARILHDALVDGSQNIPLPPWTRRQ